jgi:hypothetical protein
VSVLGRVSEVFGPVAAPFYLVQVAQPRASSALAGRQRARGGGGGGAEDRPDGFCPDRDGDGELPSIPVETISSSVVSLPKLGAAVFVVVSEGKFVTPHQLLEGGISGKKGSDASNMFDEEV